MDSDRRHQPPGTIDARAHVSSAGGSLRVLSQRDGLRVARQREFLSRAGAAGVLRFVPHERPELAGLQRRRKSVGAVAHKRRLLGCRHVHAGVVAVVVRLSP